MNVNELNELADKLEQHVVLGQTFNLSKEYLENMIIDIVSNLRGQAYELDKAMAAELMVYDDPYTTDADRRYFEGI